MIDIHCHILPGLDDGSPGLEESIQMARQAIEEGVTDLIATPHTHNGIYINDSQEVLKSVHLLQEELIRLAIPLRIYPGAEVHIHDELVKHLKQNKLPTLGDSQKYVLIEFPYGSIPLFADKVLSQLLAEGYVPVIAHPERHIFFSENLDLLRNWIRKGALTQVTADSLSGKRGWRMKRFAKLLVRSGMAHLVASDAHRANVRGMGMKEAYRILEKWGGRRLTGRFQSHAQAVLEGRGL